MIHRLIFSKNIFRTGIQLFLTVLLGAGCEAGKFTLDPNSPGLTVTGGSSTTPSDIPFGGITSIDGVTGTSLTLNWALVGGSVSSYSIYEIVAGVPLIKATVSSSVNSYTVTGLTPGQTYTYRVRLNDTSGKQDANTTDRSATTLSTSPPTSLAYSTNPATYTVGTAITANSASNSGGTPTSYSISPSLPTGLSFNTSTGQISGTATAISNQTNYTITATNTGGSTTATLPLTVNFAGISSISNVTATTLRLNWSAIAGVANYLVYSVSGGTATYVTSIASGTTQYTVTGLSTSTAYTYRVRATTTSGVTDTNTNDVSATTLSVVATSTGWSDIKAVGKKVPVTQSGISQEDAYVTLTWNAPTLSSGSAASYNLYRATTSGGFDYNSPLATGISSSTRTYTDSTVAGSTTYYYTVSAVVGGSSFPVSASEIDYQVKVIVPPDNMSLVHHWAANQEMCTLMGRSVDRTNDYRCAYTGPGGTGSYFDIGKSFFVDTYELGCNYTPAPGCGDATYGCLGTADPSTGVGSVGDVYYKRGDGKCFVKTDVATWTEANSSLSTTHRGYLTSNRPGLPPLVRVNQSKAWDSCQTQTASGFAGNKKLLTHQQQILAGAWSSSLDDTTIGNIENGSSLPSTGYCNTNNGSGLTYQDVQMPTNVETLPGTSTSGIKSVRTGGTSTVNCVSRYGVRDLTGNVWEWSSDQLGTCSSASHTCTGQSSALDTDNTHWNGFAFDGSTGPGGGGTNVTEWLFQDMSFSATQFLPPLGLPMVAAAASSYDYLAIGSSAGQFATAKFHGDRFWLYTDNGNGTPARGAFAGGSWFVGSVAGRFALYLSDTPSFTLYSIGARCALPAE